MENRRYRHRTYLLLVILTPRWPGAALKTEGLIPTSRLKQLGRSTKLSGRWRSRAVMHQNPGSKPISPTSNTGMTPPDTGGCEHLSSVVNSGNADWNLT